MAILTTRIGRVNGAWAVGGRETLVDVDLEPAEAGNGGRGPARRLVERQAGEGSFRDFWHLALANLRVAPTVGFADRRVSS